MASEVQTELRDGVAVIALDRPVANALAPKLRIELDGALRAAIADEDVRAIVLHGRGRVFCSGIDITEYDGPLAKPSLRDLCNLIEEAPKPVVAALHGAALGAGLELALAAHARVTAQDTNLAIPDITLGMVPAGGATQRLPRLIGAQAALDFILSGQTLPAQDPSIAPISDRLVATAPLPEALELARDYADKGAWPRSRDQDRGLSDPAGYQRSLSQVAERLNGKDGVEADLLKCIEAAQLLPFDRGLDLETVLFEDRVSSEEAICRRHHYVAMRRAAILPERAQAGEVKPLGHVVMLGQSMVLAELAVSCLDSGRQVTLLSAETERSKLLSERVATVYRGAFERGKITRDEHDQRLARLAVASGSDVLSQADLIFDTGQVTLHDGTPPPGSEAIWVVLGAAGQVARRRDDLPGHERLLGARLYRPAYRPGLVELLVPDGCHADAVARLAGFLTSIRRTVVRQKAIGFSVGDRMMMAMLRAGLALVDGGVSPYEIDAAARGLGFRAGPFELADIDGLKETQDRLIAGQGAGGIASVADTGLLASRILAGATGRSAGKGVYVYQAGRRKEPDRAVLSWVENRKADPDGIVARLDLGAALQAALVNEAARIIEQNAVLRASDIEVVMAKGAQFDPDRGGPLIQADFVGLLSLMKVMRLAAPLAPGVWQPAPLVDDMVKNGRGFFRRPFV